jgi:3-oxoacyl-[acyl-carrier protein] reductase
MLRINLLSTSMMVRAAASMLEKSSGCVVCISSICGLEALGCPLGYSAAKAALNSYVRGAARPLAKRRIRINAVAPGNIYFPGSTWESKLLAEPKEVEGMIQREVPLGRFGSTEEVAACVAFLASAQAGFVTGEILVVDGGQVRG